MLTLFLAYLDNENDQKLFEELYYSYAKQMLTLAESILHNHDDAEDVVSSVFLRIASKNWDIILTIKLKNDLRNYLLKATKHTALNFIKANKKGNVSLDTVVEFNMDETAELSDDSFLEKICDKIEYEEILKAIESLPEKYRDVLYYHFVLELTVSQTARSLDQSVATTKKQLVRGKKQLLSLLEMKGVLENANQQT